MGVNFLEVWEPRPEGTVGYHNSWMTDLGVTPETGAAIVGIGRSRGKMEKEQFNVQTNHGDEIEHNYGHGQQPLSMVFYLLNLLAFLAHKLLEFGDRLYQQCRAGESRRGLWMLFRSAFYLIAFTRGRHCFATTYARPSLAPRGGRPGRPSARAGKH